MIRAIAGVALLAAGGAISILTFRHDWARLGITTLGAPQRIAPEVHVLASLLGALGSGLFWGWKVGGLVCAGHLLGAFFVVRPLVERFAPERPQDD